MHRNPRLELARAQILAHRRTVGALDSRLPPGARSLRRAAWAGLQDSTPRAALLSIHARVEETGSDTWADKSLVQLWGPRFSAYVVAAEDRAIFTLGRLPDDRKRRQLASEIADQLESYLAGRKLPYGDVGRGLGFNPNRLRYAAPTGRVLIRWDGARQPTVWSVSPPDADPVEARLELARRYLHVFGPGRPDSFSDWAGITPGGSRSTFDALAAELIPVRTPMGDAWILAADEAGMRRGAPAMPSAVRLLPSGDAYFLLQSREREILVPDAARRPELWTSRVWPGAVLIGGEVAGIWRRANADVSIRTWRRLRAAERAAIEAEAASFPLPGVSSVRVRWDD